MPRRHPRLPGAIFLALVVSLAACGGESPTASVSCRAAEGGQVTITAANLVFDTACLEWAAGETITLVLVNDDSVPHNVAIYTDSSKSAQLYSGEIIDGGETIEYEIDPLEAGTYYFDCTVHPGMNGSVVVQ